MSTDHEHDDEHDDERKLWRAGEQPTGSASSAVRPAPEHVQKACDIINSIERDLVGRLADIEATMRPAAIERLRFHIIAALGDHVEAIANLAAGAIT
jgi:hypothetical protein